MRQNISAVNYEEEQRPELVMEDKRQPREQLIFLEARFKYWSVTESVFREGGKKRKNLNCRERISFNTDCKK